MHIVFRVDASTQIGTGHVMRCLTLAHALEQKQHSVSFICRELTGNLIDLIRQHAFDVIALPLETDAHPNSENQHAAWLQTSWQRDAGQCIEVLNTLPRTDCLVVDHYALDRSWEQAVSNDTDHIMVIDDLADRQHDAALLLDQNYYLNSAERYHDLLPEHTRQLLGPQYTLLRPEFTELSSSIKPRSGQIKTILIFFGGVDADNLTARTLDALQTLDSNIRTEVILGSTNPNKDEIINFCDSLDNVNCHTAVTNMAEFMSRADLAIGAGGTTTWERCYLGLPAIVFTLAQNQQAVNEDVEHAGAVLLAGNTTTPVDTIRTLLKEVLNEPDKVRSMSEAALALMRDHIGASGVVDIMEQTCAG